MLGADLAREVSTRRAVHGEPAAGHAGPVPGRRGGPGHQGRDPAVDGARGAARCGCSRPPARPPRSWPPARTGCSSPTAPATRPRPGTRWRRCAACSPQAVPVFGICLGSQILGRALGLGTYKLRFGHRGVNQPVKDLATGRVQITSHNHGFAVALPGADGGEPGQDGAGEPGAGTAGGARRGGPCAERVRRAVRDAVRPGPGQPRQPQRRRGGGAAAARRARVQRAVPPGGGARPARRGGRVRRVLRPDGAGQVSRPRPGPAGRGPPCPGVRTCGRCWSSGPGRS